MKQHTHVKLAKVGQMNPGPLGERHWLLGHLTRDIKVGEPIRAERYLRAPFPGENHPVLFPGDFLSSPVESIDGTLVKTANSVWSVEVLEPLPITHQP